MIKTAKAVKIFTVICLLLFLFVPVRLVQCFAFAFVLAVLLSYFYALILLKSIDVEKNLLDLKVAVQDSVEISFSVLNHSFLPVPVCYAEDKLTLFVFGGKNRVMFSMRPHERIFCRYRISAKERGLYSIGPVKIITSDPLGLFSVEKEIPVFGKICVRPARIRLLPDTKPGHAQGALKILNVCYEDVTLRKGTRSYRNGDELKRINWRKSAKYGSLYTNEYDATFEVPFFVFLNLCEEDYPLTMRHYKGERAIEIAAAIVEYTHSLQQPCGFAAVGTDSPFLMPAKRQTDCILDILSLIKMKPGKLDYDPVEYFKHKLPCETLFFVVDSKAVELCADSPLPSHSLERIHAEKLGRAL